VKVLVGSRQVHVVDSGPILVARHFERELKELGVGTQPAQASGTEEDLVQLMPVGTVHIACEKQPCGCAESLPKPWKVVDEGPATAGVVIVAENPRIYLVTPELKEVLARLQADLEFDELGQVAAARPGRRRADVARVVTERLDALPVEGRTKETINRLRDEVARELGVEIGSSRPPKKTSTGSS
jgi:hypothetical protein